MSLLNCINFPCKIVSKATGKAGVRVVLEDGSNLFARVRTKNGPGGDGDKVIFASSSGDVPALLSGKPLPPRPLDGKAIALDAPGDRRETLAAWLTSRENPYFTRSIANRVWANFMGVGLVEAVDDLRVTNPASNEKLLSALAKFLADWEKMKQ